MWPSELTDAMRKQKSKNLRVKCPGADSKYRFVRKLKNMNNAAVRSWGASEGARKSRKQVNSARGSER